jgi:hypothetical protein
LHYPRALPAGFSNAVGADAGWVGAKPRGAAPRRWPLNVNSALTTVTGLSAIQSRPSDGL